ncbi:putative membrane protein, partial [Marine Group I thaumarchaeote SCGC AAA799-B03]
VIGLLFGKNPLLFLSLSPHGMEDIPNYMKNDIEQYAKNRNYSKPLIVDCHNAMGEEISNEDGEDMLKAAKSCLDTLITKDSFPIEFGYANSVLLKNLNMMNKKILNQMILIL